MSRMLFFVSLAYIAGVFAWSLSPFSKPYPNEFAEFVGRTVQFKGTIAADVEEREKNIQLIVKPEGSKAGRVLITANKFSSYRYGDVLEIAGTIQAPTAFESFDYPGYLQTKRVHAVMYYPRITVVEEGHSILFSFKNRLRGVITEFLQPSIGATFGALVLGDQGKMTAEWKEKLNGTGLRHITAISGQHILILSQMLVSFFLLLGLWRRQAVCASFACMLLFILLTGMQSSAIRAGIMGGFLLLAQLIGRPNAAIRGLVFAGAAMLLLNPRLLLHDPGFQLSFLASLGIIYTLPFFARMFQFMPQAFSVRENLSVNFSAQLFTLPLLVWNFGYVSLVGILTNIILLPFIPFLIGFGLVFLLAGTVSHFLGVLFSLPIIALMEYYHLVVEFFAALPFASVGFTL